MIPTRWKSLTNSESVKLTSHLYRKHNFTHQEKKKQPFFRQKKTPEKTREYGVGFALSNTLMGSIVLPTGGLEKILTMYLNTTIGPTHLVSIYAPIFSFP